MAIGSYRLRPPVSVAAVAARWVDRLQLLEVEFGNRLQLLCQPRSFEIGREISSQARYSSYSLTSAATAAAHRLGRGGMRGAGDVGVVRPCWRSLARCRTWRSAGVIRAPPSRCLDVFDLLLSIVTVTFPGPSTFGRLVLAIAFFCSIGAPFLRPDLRSASTAPDWAGSVERDHAACRRASFLCSRRSSMLR